MKKVYLISQTVFLLFGLQHLPALYGADPEGSTGCSKSSASLKFSHGQGRCWRYCQGSSGSWCYTSKKCKSDEEKCADYTTCPGYGCSGASEGCVNKCPAPSSTTLEKIGESVGSTGCSKKWSGGYCWRYCIGSSGSWCYTGKGCVGNEESCAKYDICGARSCEGAASGCVLKCQPGSGSPYPDQATSGHNTQCLKYIKYQVQENSTFYSLQISADSRVLPKDPEIRPYVQLDESRGRKKSPNEFTRVTCANIPYVAYDVEQVFERQISDLELDPNVVPQRPHDANNPIEVVFGRPIQTRNKLGQMEARLDENGKIVLRPEVVVAEIEPRHLNLNSDNNFPEGTTSYMFNNLDAQDGDCKFRLVANVFGGPPELYNMVPGHPSVNNKIDIPNDRRRNDWPSLERAMRDHLQAANGNFVRWYVGLYYDDTETGRPKHLTYMAILITVGGNRTVLFGASENRQI